MRPINRLIIHCTATKPYTLFYGHTLDIATIRKWHLSQGYSDVGYHYLIHEDGSIERGRAESVVGAHCLGKNNGSIGICYVGGLDSNGKAADTRTNEQKTSMNLLIARLRVLYNITDIAGHNEFSSKACPCFNVKKEYTI